MLGWLDEAIAWVTAPGARDRRCRDRQDQAWSVPSPRRRPPGRRRLPWAASTELECTAVPSVASGPGRVRHRRAPRTAGRRRGGRSVRPLRRSGSRLVTGGWGAIGTGSRAPSWTACGPASAPVLASASPGCTRPPSSAKSSPPAGGHRHACPGDGLPGGARRSPTGSSPGTPARATTGSSSPPCGPRSRPRRWRGRHDPLPDLRGDLAAHPPRAGRGHLRSVAGLVPPGRVAGHRRVRARRPGPGRIRGG